MSNMIVFLCLIAMVMTASQAMSIEKKGVQLPGVDYSSYLYKNKLNQTECIAAPNTFWGLYCTRIVLIDKFYVCKHIILACLTNVKPESSSHSTLSTTYTTTLAERITIPTSTTSSTSTTSTTSSTSTTSETSSTSSTSETSTTLETSTTSMASTESEIIPITISVLPEDNELLGYLCQTYGGIWEEVSRAYAAVPAVYKCTPVTYTSQVLVKDKTNYVSIAAFSCTGICSCALIYILYIKIREYREYSKNKIATTANADSNNHVKKNTEANPYVWFTIDLTENFNDSAIEIVENSVIQIIDDINDINDINDPTVSIV